MKNSLEYYVHENIPVVARAGFRIGKQEDGKVTVHGKLNDHTNHHNSVFGGSISTALILAAWTYLRERCIETGLDEADIVIQSQHVRYLRPVTDDFRASAKTLTDEDLSSLRTVLVSQGKGRITVAAVLSHHNGNEALAEFSGVFYLKYCP